MLFANLSHSNCTHQVPINPHNNSLPNQHAFPTKKGEMFENYRNGYCTKKLILLNGERVERTCLIMTSPSASSSSNDGCGGDGGIGFGQSRDEIYEIDEQELFIPGHGIIRLGYILQLIEYNLYIRTSVTYQIIISVFRKLDVFRSLGLHLNMNSSIDDITQQLAYIQYSTGTHPNIYCKLSVSSLLSDTNSTSSSSASNSPASSIEGIYTCIYDEMNCFLLMKLADIHYISVYQQRHVAQPLEFMKPTINEANCLSQATIIDIHGQNKFSICLHSSETNMVYELDDRIYKTAAYGAVYKGWIVTFLDKQTFLRTTETYQIVVKKYSKQMILETVRADNPLTEFAALQYIGNSHPNVLGQLECLEDELFYYLIMKFCNGGELTEHIELSFPSSSSSSASSSSSIGGVNSLREQHIRYLFNQLLDGLEYLQFRGIYHRDLSLENLLITDSNHLLIIDLGMSLWVPYDTLILTPHFIPKMDPPKGKKQYVSPEALANTNPFEPYRSDLWSVGVILFVLLTGRFPVQVASPLCPFFRCIAGGGIGQIFKKYNIQISREAMDLLAHMLNVEPSLRFTIDQIRAHPWMIGG